MSPQPTQHTVPLLCASTVWTDSTTVTVAASAINALQHSAPYSPAGWVLSIRCYLCIQYTRDTGSQRRYILRQLHSGSDQYIIQLYLDEIDNRLYCRIQCSSGMQNAVILRSNKPLLYNTWLDIQVQYTASTHTNQYTLTVNNDITTVLHRQSFRWSPCAITVGQSFIGLISNISLQPLNMALPAVAAAVPADTAVQPVSVRTLPLRSLQQLDSIDEFNDPLNKSTIPYIPRENNCKRQRVIHCHDYRGGYNNDAIPQSTSISQHSMIAYNFTHWNLIDLFIYFTHERASVPTKSYIDTCHRNGVLCLGTFIVEWQAGTDELLILLDTPATWQHYADKLVQVAVYYGFDGYLLNIESSLSDADSAERTAEYINRLKQFITYLNQQMHRAIPHSMIIWYDSISSLTGCIEWQSELNQHNVPFFDVCDAIFLDYKYNSDKLVKSYAAAGERHYDVYVGVDVYGRGQVGGGGYNSYVALDMIQQNQLSIALFGAGWVEESACSGVRATRCFYELADRKFWLGDDYREYTITQYDASLCSNAFELQYDSIVCCYVSVASAKVHARGVKYNLRKLLHSQGVPITATTTVHCIQRYCGTGPNYADPLHWIVALTDLGTNTVVDVYDTGTITCTAQWQTLTYIFNAYQILKKYISIELSWLIVCSDAEHWAGYHGARLADGIILCTGDMQCPSIAQYVKAVNNTPTLDETLPLHHTFNTGIGQRMYVAGQSVQQEAWYQLTQQDVQTILDIRPHNSSNTSPTVQCSITMSTAYNGGTSIAFYVSIDTEFQPLHQVFNIFTFNRAPSSARKQRQYQVQYTVRQSQLCQLTCHLLTDNNLQLPRTDARVLHTQNNWCTYQTTVTVPQYASVASLCCTLTVSHRVIAEPHCMAAYLGQVVISKLDVALPVIAGKLPCTLHCAQWQVDSALCGVEQYSAVIRWSGNPALPYDIYWRDQWIGRTTNTFYSISEYHDVLEYNTPLQQYYVVCTV